MKRLWFLMALFLVSAGAYAQIDTEFWFAAPDLEVNHAQEPVRFCIVSYDEAATVVFEQPANPIYTQQTFHLDANDFEVYDVSDIIYMVETQPYNTALNYGFHIFSDTPVSIYYESDNNNSEIYSLKGQNALGTEFVVPMQYTFENYYASTCSRIEVVASQDNTEVTFIPSVAIKDFGMPGVPVTVTLNRGQSYAIEAASPQGSAHLRNTRITATKPIAVNTSDDSVNLGGHYDLVGDQIVPIDLLGTDYIAIWNNNPDEYLYFFPTEDNTCIYLNGGNSPVATLDVGQEYTCQITSPVYYIHADRPISVFQLSSSSQNEFGGTVLPQISCTGSRKTVYKRQSTSNLVVTLIVRTPFIDGFVLNGNANHITASDFTTVPSHPDYSYCKKNVSNYVPTNGLMSLENTYAEGYFHLGILTGIEGDTWNYGYFSDYQSYAFAEFEMDDTYCSGQDIEFFYSSESVSNLTLLLPDGNAVQLPYVLNNAQPNQSGTYLLQGEDCSGVHILDEIDITINSAGETTISLEGCYGFTWHGNTFTHSVDSTWMVPGSGAIGCDSIYNLHVTIYPSYETTIIEEEVCPDQLPYYFYGQAYYSSTDITVMDSDIHGCDSAVRLVLTVSDYYHADTEVVYSCYESAPSYTWNPVGDYQFTYTQEGFYTDTLPTDNCEGIYSLELHFMQVPDEEYTDTIVCESYTWPANGQTYTEPDDYYHSVPLDPFPCQRVYHLHLAAVNHRPSPVIECSTPGVVYPHHPVTATEFNVNRYTYHASDSLSDYTWIDSLCRWSISKESWRIIPIDNNRSCDVYPMEWEEDTVWLTFKAVSPCSNEGDSVSFWLKPSFYGMEEQEVQPFTVEIVPNPNNGQMELWFQRLTGRIDVKVYDMRGNKVDQFEVDGQWEDQVVRYDRLGRATGVYLFVVTGKEGTVTKKVIVGGC